MMMMAGGGGVPDLLVYPLGRFYLFWHLSGFYRKSVHDTQALVLSSKSLSHAPRPRIADRNAPAPDELAPSCAACSQVRAAPGPIHNSHTHSHTDRSPYPSNFRATNSAYTDTERRENRQSFPSHPIPSFDLPIIPWEHKTKISPSPSFLSFLL
jgi:hypothetical protein